MKLLCSKEVKQQIYKFVIEYAIPGGYIWHQKVYKEIKENFVDAMKVRQERELEWLTAITYTLEFITVCW